MADGKIISVHLSKGDGSQYGMFISDGGSGAGVRFEAADFKTAAGDPLELTEEHVFARVRFNNGQVRLID